MNKAGDSEDVQSLRTQLALAAGAGALSVTAKAGSETPWMLKDVKHDAQHGARALERHELGWRPPPSRHAALVDATSGAEPPKSMNRPVIDRHCITDVQQQAPAALEPLVVQVQKPVASAPAAAGGGSAGGSAGGDGARGCDGARDADGGGGT